jgi:hypothetical protein
MFSGRDSRLWRQIRDLVVDGRLIIKVKIECKGRNIFTGFTIMAGGRIFEEHNKPLIP